MRKTGVLHPRGPKYPGATAPSCCIPSSQISWVLHPPGPTSLGPMPPAPGGALRLSFISLRAALNPPQVSEAVTGLVWGWFGWLWPSPSPEISAGLWLSPAGKAAENRPALCKNGNCVADEKCFLWVGCLCFLWHSGCRSVCSTCPGRSGGLCSSQSLIHLKVEERKRWGSSLGPVLLCRRCSSLEVSVELALFCPTPRLGSLPCVFLVCSALRGELRGRRLGGLREKGAGGSKREPGSHKGRLWWKFREKIPADEVVYLGEGEALLQTFLCAVLGEVGKGWGWSESLPAEPKLLCFFPTK